LRESLRDVFELFTKSLSRAKWEVDL
jgi:hypothetical protein